MHGHPDNKPIIFALNANKLLTAAFLLSCSFPVQHLTTTMMICLKRKFDHIVLRLQNGFSTMVSQSYAGFQAPPRPASSPPFLPGFCYSPSQLDTPGALRWVHSIHLGVFYPSSSLPGNLSPLQRSTCGIVFIILQELDLRLRSLLWPPKQR